VNLRVAKKLDADRERSFEQQTRAVESYRQRADAGDARAMIARFASVGIPAGVEQAKTMLARLEANERSEQQAREGLTAEAKRAAALLKALGNASGK
jgi:hypothetical protein